MKRYKAHIIEGNPEARQFVKDYIDAQIQKYTDSLTTEVLDTLTQEYLNGFDQEYLDTLTQTEIDNLTQSFTDGLIPIKRKQIKTKIGDSIEKCPQIGKRCAFIDPVMTGNKVKHLLQLCDVIQFGKTFVYDTGTEALPITIDNYKSIPYLDWLNEIPEIYIIDEP